MAGSSLPHGVDSLCFLLLHNYSQSQQRHLQIKHKISCQQTLLWYLSRVLEGNKLNYRRILWLKKNYLKTHAWAHTTDRAHFHPWVLAVGWAQLVATGTLLRAWWMDPGSDQLGFHGLEHYAFVSLVQLFAAKWLNHIVHVTRGKKIKVEWSKISLCTNSRRLVSVQRHFPTADRFLLWNLEPICDESQPISHLLSLRDLSFGSIKIWLSW